MSVELFHQYWWLIFPIFGMAMGFWGMVSDERRTRSMLDVLREYAQQGKDPPAELLRIAERRVDEWGFESPPREKSRAERSSSFVTFLALGAGFGVAYYFNQGEDWSWAFLAVAVAMGVMALGALVQLIFARKP